MNGTDLLGGFRQTGAEAPFRELMRRYTNLVFSVAKRRLGNVSLAEEVTQTVFIRLAKAVPNIRSDAELVAWLHRTTVHASIDLWRSEFRRRNREEHAAIMQPDCTEDAAWKEIAPVLDEALNELSDAERQVILLRFFDQRSMREVGSAFGITEDAAKMRVSRAMDRLRTAFSEKGVMCTVAGLGGLLAARAVDAAPGGLVLMLAEIKLPIAAGVGAGVGLAALLAQIAKSKLAAVIATAVIVGTVAIIWVHSTNLDRNRGNQAREAASPLTAGDTSLIDAVGRFDTNGSAGEPAPEPLKLIQGVVRARNRILSGEMEFLVVTYEFSRPLDGTNIVRLKALFDGTKRRLETFRSEYAYTSSAPDAREVTDTRRRAEGLDREAAVRAGLLRRFDSHHVTAYDGALLLDYWESDGKPEQAKIDNPAKGSGEYIFDPRCLGIGIAPNVRDTIESCLGIGNSNSGQLVGEELVAGLVAWHVRVRRGSMDADFWFDKAHPVRVLKYAFNGSIVISIYNDADPRDPMPIEVEEMMLHGTVGSQTAFTERRIIRRSARIDIPMDPVSWTLAGLGMQIGTDVIDYRISRMIGYWTGTGLSENLPFKTGEQLTAPDRAQLLSVLDYDSRSTSALEAAQWILFNTPDGPEVTKAGEVILHGHIENTNLVYLCQELERLRHSCSPKLLVALIEKNPSAEVRGNACLALATLRKEDAKYGTNKQAVLEAEKLFQRVIAEFAQVKRNGTPLSDLAKPELSELQHLTIGKPAPATEGEDLEGRRLRLRDYRGKVVLLTFWGACGGCRPDVRALHALLDRFKGKPFAILGVYCEADVTKAKEIVEKTGMAWPSFRDGRSGPISREWNNNAWPVFQIVDSKGVIRYRNVWELQFAQAVESLMAE